jgi:hypothetical protein
MPTFAVCAKGFSARSCKDYDTLRVLPHSSTPAILSKTRLRMRLWTSRGSCPCPWRSIWGWDPKEAQHLGGGGLPDTLSAGRRNPSCAKEIFRAQKGPDRDPWTWDLGA